MDDSLQKEKTDFFLVSVHELRTSLSATKWLFAMLLKGDFGPLTDEQRTMLTQASNANEHMVRLVSEVLDAVRSDELPHSYTLLPIDLDALTSETINLFQQQAHESDMFIRYIPHEQTTVLGDRTRLEIVLHNLIDNAIKYGTPNTDITVSLAHKEDSAILMVRDHGIGVPANEQSKLFERFFRSSIAKKKTSGVGLGLYAVKQIIIRHGGTVTYSSTEGVGTTFTITLPLISAH